VSWLFVVAVYCLCRGRSLSFPFFLFCSLSFPAVPGGTPAKPFRRKNITKYLNTIIKGDCLVNLPCIPDKSIDLIFADPPYWMQTGGELHRADGSRFAGVEDGWDKFSTYKEYDDFSQKWLKECKRILKPNGSIWVIGSFQNIYRLGYIMQDLGFWVLNDVIWSKPNAAPNFKGTRFRNAHETLLWCCPSKNSKYVFNYKTMKSLNGGKQDKSVWDIGICIGNERIKDEEGKKAHSTQKPEKLLYKVILSTSKPNDIVLDPFFGLGTTGAVAKQLGRNYIGFEKDAKYIGIAKKRIAAVKFENNSLHNLALETKPPRISVKELIEHKYLKTGEKLYDKKGTPIGSLTSNGYVDDSQEILSIHKMSAKKLHRPTNNGWHFFFCRRNQTLKSLNDLRRTAGNDNDKLHRLV
jgi:site-specific DNA-methyltransferase (adenine-specific)